jgi:hypothetical protein
MYTFDVREPVRADEKHLGRVRRHFIDTDVQLSNYELRHVGKYEVALKVARTGKGVALLQDIPGVGVLFRPLPSAGSSLQQNHVYNHCVIFPTLYELMGLRFAPAVADLDPLKLINDDFIVRYRRNYLINQVYDLSSASVDDALRIEEAYRRSDLYRSQNTIPSVHPNGYFGPGRGVRDGVLQDGYDPEKFYPTTPHVPLNNPNGVPATPGSSPIPAELFGSPLSEAPTRPVGPIVGGRLPPPGVTTVTPARTPGTLTSRPVSVPPLSPTAPGSRP